MRWWRWRWRYKVYKYYQHAVWPTKLLHQLSSRAHIVSSPCSVDRLCLYWQFCRLCSKTKTAFSHFVLCSLFQEANVTPIVCLLPESYDGEMTARRLLALMTCSLQGQPGWGGRGNLDTARVEMSQVRGSTPGPVSLSLPSCRAFVVTTIRIMKRLEELSHRIDLWEAKKKVRKKSVKYYKFLLRPLCCRRTRWWWCLECLSIFLHHLILF